MLLCVEKKASLYPFLKKGADFCINILSESQDNILELCVNGAQGEERFSMGDWRTSQFGIPYLADGQASIICSSAECWEYTTHGVFVGIASEAYVNSDVSPLIYYRQGFTSLRA
jgi:flavin reductase (DIM6/NTAB) family NADH-FMN oxidoreductase RutF